MEKEKLFELLQKVEKIVKEKREEVLRRFNEIKHYEFKDAKDLVTSTDKELELYFREKLQSLLSSNVLGEEFGKSNEEMPYTWVIDPIDGTTNFTHKIPFFNTAIALLDTKSNEVLLGLVYYYHLDLMFKAIKGQGAWVNDLKISRSYTLPLSKSFISFCHANSEEAISYIANIFGKVKLKTLDFRRLGAANLEICYVALGKLGAFFGYKLKPWDFLASCLIAEEAGLVVRALNTNNWQDPNAETILVCWPSIEKELLELLR